VVGAVADALAAEGYRTIAPYVRGFRPTRFNEHVERTAELAALTDISDRLHVRAAADEPQARILHAQTQWPAPGA